jgi:glyoxylase-like metal-dependent hydrolase (beta-lactamase superfamily II)
VYFKQFVKEDLGCASYLVGCTDTGSYIVVDPRLDMVEDILELVAAKSMQLTAVIETHLHADHLPGHRELARLEFALTLADAMRRNKRRIWYTQQEGISHESVR